MNYILKVFISTLFLFLLVGCGGVKMETSSNSLFPGSASLAPATSSNGAKVADMLLSYNLDNAQPSLKLVSKPRKTKTLLDLELSTLKMLQNRLDNNRLQRVVDEGDNCINGGTYYKSGEITKEYGGEIEYNYNNCQIGETIYDGIMRVKASSYDYDLRYFKNLHIEYITNFNTNYYDTTYTIKAGSTIDTKLLSKNSIKILSNIVSKYNGELRGFKDVEFIVEKLIQGTTLYQTKGRIYINNLKNYVEYDSGYDMSQSPFEYDSSNSVVSGEAFYKIRGGTLDISIIDGELTIDIL